MNNFTQPINTLNKNRNYTSNNLDSINDNDFQSNNVINKPNYNSFKYLENIYKYFVLVWFDCYLEYSTIYSWGQIEVYK